MAKKTSRSSANETLGRVELDLDDLGVARAAGADLLVGRVGHLAAHVAGLDRLDASEFVVDRFETPEAAAGERRNFERGP